MYDLDNYPMALLPLDPNIDNIDDKDLLNFVENCEKQNGTALAQQTSKTLNLTNYVQNFQSNQMLPAMPRMYFPHSNVTINYNSKQ